MMKALKDNKTYFILYLLLYIPCILINRDLDNDIWFILNSGRYVLNSGIPHIEPFTIHKGMSFVMQQWLSAVIFFTTYNFSGKSGLVLIVILFYMLFAFMTFKLSMLMSDNNFPVSFVISFITVSLMYPFMVQRPHIFLFLFIVIELYLLEKYIRLNKNIYLLMLLPLSVLLINMEAAMWPMLFIVLLPYLIDSFKFKFHFIEGQGYRKKPLFLTALAMAALGYINPYRIEAVTYLFKSYGNSTLDIISEIAPVNINSVNGKLIFLTIFLVIISIFAYRKGKYKLRYYLLTFGTLYMALSSVRSFSFFIICGIIPLSNYFKDFNPEKLKGKRDKKTLLIRKLLIILLTAAVVITLIINNTAVKNMKQQELVKCADYLQKLNDMDAGIYTGFNEGGYLEFRGFRTYIDSRAEVFFKNNNKKYDIMQEYINLQSGKTYYKKVLDKYNFKYILVDSDDILFNYLAYDKQYKLLYGSTYYKIYENTK